MTVYPFVPAGTETEVLLSTLDRNRRTLAWKCGGLHEAGTRATLGPSAITLGGLLKHLALCEDWLFTVELRGEPFPEPWTSRSGDEDALWAWTWTSALQESPAELMALWQASVARSRVALDAALAHGDLGQPVPHSTWSVTPDLRRKVADLIEEYARHTGHADLIRESVDGLVGEDAPSVHTTDAPVTHH